MEVKCDYCGSMISDELNECPNCGAPNEHMARMADHTPQTIEELKQWYEARKLPPSEVTRFFIGVDYKKPKAFGIYEEDGTFIVYKNKEDGSRAVRYKGTDEAYAVNELYLKLKSEILHQKERNIAKGRVSAKAKSRSTSRNGSRSNYGSSSNYGSTKKKRSPWKIGCITIPACFYLGGGSILMFSEHLVGSLLLIGIPALILLGLYLYDRFVSDRGLWENIGKRAIPFFMIYLFLVVTFGIGSDPASTAATYSSYDNSVYCMYDDLYYTYQDNDYVPVSKEELPAELRENWDTYTISDSDTGWDSSYSFTDSDYYRDNIYEESSYSSSSSSGSSYSDSDYDWDSGWSWDSDSGSSYDSSDYSWDYDSYDYGGSDWDSDW